MEKLVTKIDKKGVEKRPNIEDFDILVSKKHDLLGISLVNEIILLRSKPIYSYRLKIENFTSLKQINFFKTKVKIDKEFLEMYFAENNDNPFSINLILNEIQRGHNINKETIITQFPPLNPIKDTNTVSEKFATLIAKAKLGDLVFMYDRESVVSKIIRETDFCPWSHSATLYSNTIIQDMTTGGMIRYPIQELEPYKYDIALYRLPKELDKAAMIAELDRLFNQGAKYNWEGIIKVYLIKKFRFFKFLKKDHPWKGKTGADLIFNNNLELIDYI